eukprot:2513550-Rhodomonas_salina.1
MGVAEQQFASNTQQQDWKLDSDAGATRAIPERAIDPKERIQEYKMRNLRVSQMRRQGIPMEAIRAAGSFSLPSRFPLPSSFLPFLRSSFLVLTCSGRGQRRQRGRSL